MKNPFADLTRQALGCMFLASIGAVLFVSAHHPLATLKIGKY
jgi:hypothetical protein